jgi:hypothetical protein
MTVRDKPMNSVAVFRGILHLALPTTTQPSMPRDSCMSAYFSPRHTAVALEKMAQNNFSHISFSTDLKAQQAMDGRNNIHTHVCKHKCISAN